MPLLCCCSTAAYVSPNCAVSSVSDIVMGERKGLLKVVGKGANHREVPLNSTARFVLASYLEKYKPDRWLFFSARNRDNKLEPRNVQKLCEKYSKILRHPCNAPYLAAHLLYELDKSRGANRQDRIACRPLQLEHYGQIYSAIFQGSGGERREDILELRCPIISKPGG